MGTRSMTFDFASLAGFGWHNHFTAQLTTEDFENALPARVAAVHRSGLHIIGPGLEADIQPVREGSDAESAATVGDWLLLERGSLRPRRILDRKSLLKRRAAGTGRQIQLIAANIDTLFIVTSCNQDFNIARLERYLALAREAGTMPIVVMSKADLTEDAEAFIGRAMDELTGVLVEAIDARNPESVARLTPYLGRGQTVALVGSSGVGKSTLINTLSQQSFIATQGIREDDAKGRHTTTGRALYRLTGGAWLVDTPGMRELQLADAEQGIASVFEDILALAEGCRFSDCRHDDEPGCAVVAAIEDGRLDGERLRRWRKLRLEEAHNSASLAERRDKERKFGKMVKRAMAEKERWK